MKILISAQYLCPPVGGAEYSLLTLAKKLSEKHEVYVLQPGKNDAIKKTNKIVIIEQKVPFYYKLIWYDHLYSPWWIYHISPVIFQAKYWKCVIEKNINEIKPDLIITQLNFAPPSIDAAVRYGIPSILFIRSYEHFCPIDFIHGIDCKRQCKKCVALHNKLHFLFMERWLKWNEKALKNANLVVANSKYVANIATEWYNINPVVVYPNINIDRYICKKHSQKYVTLVKPTKNKGVDIFLNIATRMQGEKFLIVGRKENTLYRKIQQLRNVEYIEWTNQVTDVYSETKILLAPTIWPEPFGRIIVEAEINGIPTIASNIGGLPEAVGTGGILIDNIYNIDEWVEAIQSLEDKTLYDRLSENAKRHAQKFDFEITFKDFTEVVKREFEFEL